MLFLECLTCQRWRRGHQRGLVEEIFSKANEQFVLHDSKGFEAGEADNLQIVKDFIKRRNDMPDIKDKLHAIWYALMI